MAKTITKSATVQLKEDARISEAIDYIKERLEAGDVKVDHLTALLGILGEPVEENVENPVDGKNR